MPRQRRTATKRQVFTREQYEALGDPLVQELFEPWEDERTMCRAYLASSSAIVRAWVMRDPPYVGWEAAGPGTRPGVFWLLELDLAELEAEGILKPDPLGHGRDHGDTLVSVQPYVQPTLLTLLDAWLPGERDAFAAEGSGSRWQKRLRYHLNLAASGHHFTMPLEVGRP